MTWDWPTYFHDYGQENSKYQLVNPTTAINLVEKYVQLLEGLHLIFASVSCMLCTCPLPLVHFRLREADKRTMFSVLKKSERDKKKLLETVLKQLRQLAQTQQQQSQPQLAPSTQLPQQQQQLQAPVQ